MGDFGLAAINISLPIFSLLFGFALMLAIGGSVIAGKLIGEEDIKNASIIFTKTIVCITFFSFITCSLLFLNIETVLYLFGADENLTKIAIEYLSVIVIFIPFLMIGVVLDYFVRVDNRPNLAFIALFSSAIIQCLAYKKNSNNKNKTPMRLTSKSIRIRKRISVVVVSNELFNMATFFILKALPW